MLTDGYPGDSQLTETQVTGQTLKQRAPEPEAWASAGGLGVPGTCICGSRSPRVPLNRESVAVSDGEHSGKIPLSTNRLLWVDVVKGKGGTSDLALLYFEHQGGQK